MKKIVVALLLISMLLMTLSSCTVTTGAVMKLVEEGKYEEAYKLASLFGDEELLSHFYWVPVDVTTNGQVSEHKYNEHNLPIGLFTDENSYQSFAYNENGLTVKTIRVEGNTVTTIIQDYDEQGRIIYIRYDVDGYYSASDIVYNEEGLAIKKIYGGNIGDEHVTDIVYNEKGQPIQEISTYPDGTVEYKDYTYDEKGNLISETYPAGDGTIQTNTYVYDDEGRLVAKNTVFSDGLHWTYEYTYNEDGRVSRQFYHGGYNLESNDFATSRDYFYDEHGNVIKSTYIDGGLGSVEITNITYRLVYVPFVYEDGITWSITPYVPH